MRTFLAPGMGRGMLLGAIGIWFAGRLMRRGSEKRSRRPEDDSKGPQAHAEIQAAVQQLAEDTKQVHGKTEAVIQARLRAEEDRARAEAAAADAREELLHLRKQLEACTAAGTESTELETQLRNRVERLEKMVYLLSGLMALTAIYICAGYAN